jgi:hypothetical protein
MLECALPLLAKLIALPGLTATSRHAETCAQMLTYRTTPVLVKNQPLKGKCNVQNMLPVYSRRELGDTVLDSHLGGLGGVQEAQGRCLLHARTRFHWQTESASTSVLCWPNDCLQKNNHVHDLV